MAISDAAFELPPVDQRLVAPGSLYEVYDGLLVGCPPADELCDTRRSELSSLILAHVAVDFDVAMNMLTRTSKTSDVAPNISVFPHARDPATGGRQLERLAFDIVRTAFLDHSGRKASKLTARGVRRVFAVDVELGWALEWSRPHGDWARLASDAEIEDGALAVPLPIKTLVEGTSVDDAMARALIAKENCDHEKARAKQARAEDLTQAKVELLITMLGAGGVVMEDADRERILGEQDARRVDRWIACAFRCVHVAELFEVP